MKKQENEYIRLTLYFNKNSKRQMDAFRFLNMITRKCTSFVTELVLNYLKKNGINNVNCLSKEQANKLLQNPDSFQSSIPNNQNITPDEVLRILSMILPQNPDSFSFTQQKPEPIKPRNNGRFKKKEERIEVSDKPDNNKPEIISDDSFSNTSPPSASYDTDYTKDDEDYDDSAQNFLPSSWEKSLEMFDD